MVCIYCGSKTVVNNSRSSTKLSSTWRRRQCTSCHAIFTSRETVELEKSLRVKSPSGILKPFQRDKLFLTLYQSILHRKTPLEDAGALTDTVLTKVLRHSEHHGLIESEEIRVTIISTLNSFDLAAKTHYEAHHP